MKKAIYLVIGTISLIIGIVAIFIPILPTTPFLLLSSYLYFKSSKKAYEKLINSKLIGEYIKNYQEKKGIPIKVKISTITLLWLSIISSILFFVKKWYVKLPLFTVGVLITIHILKIKTYKTEN